jgi:histidine triad (HIT) family protein
VAKAIKAAIPCQRVGMAVLGMEVPHTHIHLVPLNKESDMKFDKEKLKLSEDRMAEIARQIAEKFE